MKYLFIVQGEGRGHLTQAIALSQMLTRKGHQVQEVLVGRGSNRELPSYFKEKIGASISVFDSPALDYGKNGKKGKILKSILLNTSPRQLVKWRRSMELMVRRVEQTKPDVIVNFYEILAGLTNLIYRLDVPMVCIGHQFLIDHPDYAYRSKTDYGQFALRLNNMLCSFGASQTIALSFYPLKYYYKERMAVLPPLLRAEIFDLKPYHQDYILGYVLNAAYMDDLIQWHRKNPESKLHLFWDKNGAAEEFELEPGMTIHQISDTKFLSLMEGCKGYVTTAGFESICEAMYLAKPVLMIPAHIEQAINAADAQGAGAGIVSNEFNISQLIDFIPSYNSDNQKFRDWVDSAEDQFLRHLTTLV